MYLSNRIQMFTVISCQNIYPNYLLLLKSLNFKVMKQKVYNKCYMFQKAIFVSFRSDNRTTKKHIFWHTNSIF